MSQHDRSISKVNIGFDCMLITTNKMYLNLFEFFVILIHDITFNCSPINNQRYISDYKLARSKNDKKESGSIERENTNLNESQDWSVLLRPIELFKLIKRYHICGNVFIIYFITHLLYLFHVTIKCSVHTFITGSNLSKMEFFNSIYYPHLLGAFPRPYLFNNLFLALCLLYICIRFLAAIRLIRGSIINACVYKEIYISQINLSSVTLMNLSWRDWCNGFIKPFEHLEQVEKFPSVRQRHFSLDEQLRKLSVNLSDRDMKFQFNSVDFADCYHGWIDDIGETRERFKLWHHVEPPERIPSYWLIKLIILACFGLTILMICPLVFATGVLYLELRSSLPAESQPGLLEVLSRIIVHLANPLHVLRVSELFIFALLTLPHNIDAMLLYVDSVILVGRVRKVTQIMDNELTMLRNYNITICGSSQSGNLDFDRSDVALKCITRMPEEIVFAINERLLYEIRIVRVLYSEFTDVRRIHSDYVNIIIIGTGICMSYIISISSVISGPAEFFVLLTLFASCCAPFIGLIIACALIEQTVSGHYNLKVVNNDQLFDFNAIFSIL